MARPPAPRVRPSVRLAPARPDAVNAAYQPVETLDDDDDDAEYDAPADEEWREAAELQRLGGTGEYGARPRAVGPSAQRLRSPRARVIDAASGAEQRSEPAWRGALREGLRGVRVALEALGIAWLTVVIPVVAGYVATVAAPSLGDASWVDAARGATAGWLLGLGEPLAVHTPATATSPEVITQVTLVPLGLTALVLILLAGGVRRAGLGSLAGAAGVTLAAAAGSWLAYSFAETAPTSRAVVTQLGVLALALVIGMRATLSRRRPAHALLRQLTDWAVAGVRAGALALVWLGVLAALLVLLALLGSLADVLAVQRALGADPVSTVVMTLAQAAALVTLVVWAAVWLAGPGFAIGAVSVTPVAASAGPLPALPVLAVVPDAGPGPGRWVSVVIVLIVAIALLRPLGRTRSWAEIATTAGVAVLTFALVGWAAAGLSGGEVGPLTPVGTSGGAAALALAIEAAIGAVLALGAVIGLRLLHRDPAQLGEPVVRAAARARAALGGGKRRLRRD